MKKLIITAAILTFNFSLSTLNCCAQLLNGGFEDWTTQYNFENPDHWETLNVLSLFSNPLSAFKAVGVDKHSGNYALKLKTIVLSNNPAPQLIPDTIGFVFTGKINISPPSMKLGIPYTGRPEKIELWAKYTPVGNDLGAIVCNLLKSNGVNHDTVASAELTLPATNTYTLFQVPLNYNLSEQPDSAIIRFSSSKYIDDARVGSTMFIDDVSFTGWVGIEESGACGTDKVKIFPNPAKENITILAQIDEADNVQVVDASGKLVNVYKIQNYKAIINTSILADGIYFYTIHDKKDRTLTKGKFNVIK